jgi:hypothetical protein
MITLGTAHGIHAGPATDVMSEGDPLTEVVPVLPVLAVSARFTADRWHPRLPFSSGISMLLGTVLPRLRSAANR